jgi:NAD(P)-dependent dehydrogenase (short-subunit alcohol dehydrogenase family)
VALPTESVYCMTKAAIAHLTKCLAIEWGKYNITMNAVAPTFIRTPGTEGALANPEFCSDVIERIAALHRIGEPMDVAGWSCSLPQLRPLLRAIRFSSMTGGRPGRLVGARFLLWFVRIS